MMMTGTQRSPCEIPGEALTRILGRPGDDTAGTLGIVYTQATLCQGLAILVNPSVRTALTVAVGMRRSGEGDARARVYIIDSGRAKHSLLMCELAKEGLSDEVTHYHGNTVEFFRDLPLLPSLICIGVEAREQDLIYVCRHVPAGAPVLVMRATDWPDIPANVQTAAAHGLLSEVQNKSGVLLCMSANVLSRSGLVPPVDARVVLQGALHERYFLSPVEGSEDHTPVADLTERIRRSFSREFPTASGYGVWPYLNPDPVDLPSRLPGEKPWPKISIVTPSFNQGRYIEETILSVLNQGYPNVEYIVVDGGSTDETLRVLDQYRDKISQVISEPDNGQSHAINKGMSLATGQILTWLNSDDRLAPGALAAVALAFETSGADMVAGICRLYRNGACERQHLTACADGPLPLENLLDLDHGWNAGQFFYQPEVMFTRELWQRAGGHVNDWLHYSMDYELWLRFAEAGAYLHVIGRPVAWYRVHDQQKTFLAEDFQPELVLVRDGFVKTRGGAVPAMTKTVPSRSALRVTFLNDHGASFGAGIAHVRIARGMARAGHAVTLVSILDRPSYGRETPNYSVESVVARVASTKPDLVIVGNLHNAAVEPLLLNFLSESFPTLVVLHDFWILTGRCAYSGDCQKYLTGCDETCPTADEYPALEPLKIADAWRKKQLLLYAESRPSLLAYSSWAASFAESGLRALATAGTSAPAVGRFRLGFPLEVFRPRDRRSCREAFRLPPDAFIVLLPASLEDRRKGGRAFLEALEHLELPNLLVVTLGQIADSVETRVKVLQLGYLTDPYLIAQLNSAADVVAVPSSAETFGQVCVESIACGTPVVGYPVTAIKEAVRDGVTGLLAADTNPASLAATVHCLYANPELRRDLSRWGRLFVENEWSEFSSYRHLQLALHALELTSSLNLRRNISFLANDPAVPEIQSIWRSNEQWVPLRGFSGRESVPEHGLERFWWMLGPTATAELFAKEEGQHQILISYRNPWPHQCLKVHCNGMVLGNYDLAQTGYDKGSLIVMDARLVAGANHLHFEFSRWFSHDHDTRPLTIMLVGLLAAPATAKGALVADLASEQMLARTWGHVPQ